MKEVNEKLNKTMIKKRNLKMIKEQFEMQSNNIKMVKALM